MTSASLDPCLVAQDTTVKIFQELTLAELKECKTVSKLWYQHIKRITKKIQLQEERLLGEDFPSLLLNAIHKHLFKNLGSSFLEVFHANENYYKLFKWIFSFIPAPPCATIINWTGSLNELIDNEKVSCARLPFSPRQSATRSKCYLIKNIPIICLQTISEKG